VGAWRGATSASVTHAVGVVGTKPGGIWLGLGLGLGLGPGPGLRLGLGLGL
jgi:hypothetical protein